MPGKTAKEKLIALSWLLFLIFSVNLLFAQEPYKLPPKEIVDILDAPPLPMISLDPQNKTMLLSYYQSMPSIDQVSQPFYGVAGLRITPHNNSRQVLRFYTKFVLKNIKTGKEISVNLPEGPVYSLPDWSPDGNYLALKKYLGDGLELWLVDASTGQSRKLFGPSLNAVLTEGYIWWPDSRSLLITINPANRGPQPPAPRVPAGPNIQETSGKKAAVATYQDLLRTPFDEKIFEYLSTIQLARLDIRSGELTNLGQPGMYQEVSPSPSGEFILINKIKRPFSYSIPFRLFSHTFEVWDSQGNLIKIIADLPVAEEVPRNGVPVGPRSLAWQPLKPATLIWVEALDEGDPEKSVPARERIMSLEAPFNQEAVEILRLPERYQGIVWLGRPGQGLISQYEWKKRWRTTYLFATDRPGFLQKIFDLNAQDQYNDPGRPVMTSTPSGDRVAVQDGDYIYLRGSGSSPEGDRPFIDRFNLRNGQVRRLFQCDRGVYETFISFYGQNKSEIITSFESPTTPPNYYLVNLKTKKRTALTSFPDPAPQLTAAKRQLVKYKRNDGVELSGFLYLPPDYQEGQRLPLVVWAYPMEYNDPSTAGQVRGSPYRFTFYRGASQLFYLTQGYAVLDNAQMPVVGDPKTMNDTFIPQIVANAEAAIDTLDRMGVIDRKRVGVGGHSYGAFMTANLLAHSDLFAAGVARSGAYNRTLTPFGFQNERRTLWEAPELYCKVSPFMYADKINEPLLLIHGEADNNSGTFPIQSERLFAAIKGLGGTARLVMLPNESHGYSARESVLHVLAEMIDWFDRYVKKR
ncbi:MAG: prolyl oligopeptidase family serine peptidase [Candidatus Saccharicenans sp.]|jgi:dipeptidyl aminopeptidase/acylaminoacyl peptidase|nr:prolyl oligopeptidase family serine peptidase [Candidatus Saccharicenans sp.]